MAGLMAAERPTGGGGLSLASVGPGVLSDTGGIYNGPGIERGVNGQPITVQPQGPTYNASPLPPPVSYNQQAAQLYPQQLAPPPPPPQPTLMDHQADWAGALDTKPDPGLGAAVPGKGIVDATGNQFMPLGAVEDTSNLIGNVDMSSVGGQGLSALSQFVTQASGQQTSMGKALDYWSNWERATAPTRDKTDQKYQLANSAQVEGIVKAGMGPKEIQDYYQLKDVLSRNVLAEGSAEKADVEASLNNVVIQAQYRFLVEKAQELQNTTGTGPKGSANEFGGFFQGNLLGGGTANLDSPNVVLWYDPKSNMYSLMTKGDAVKNMISDARTDPQLGGKLILALDQAKLIPGADEKYVTDYLRFDKAGHPYSEWPSQFDSYVSEAVDRIAILQATQKAPDKFVGGVWQQLYGQGSNYQDVQNNPNLVDKAYGSPGSSSGSSSSKRPFVPFGSSGFGSSMMMGRMFQSDPALLTAMLDSQGKSKLGRAMSADEHAKFIDYVHNLEAQQQAVYMSGGKGMAYQPDPQSQALQWILAENSQDMQNQQQGDYVKDLAAFLRGPGLGGGSAST